MDDVLEQKKVNSWQLIVGYLGLFVFVAGIICLCPLFVLFFYPTEANLAWIFVYPGCGAIVVGFFVQRICLKGKDRVKANLTKGQGAILLVLLWIVAIAVCSIPFMLYGKSFTHAIFESTCGLGTAGLTIFTGLENVDKIMLFYRILLLLFGGAGLVLVVTSVMADRYGVRLYNAEGHTEKLLPNIVKTARLIVIIYLAYIIVGTFALFLCGMSLFDAVCYAISAVATGGFGNADASIGAYNSVAIETVLSVLMILGATNFGVVALLLFRGKVKKFWRHSEIRFFCIFLICAVPVLLMCVYWTSVMDSVNNVQVGGDVFLSFRTSIFHFISASTTTGFSLSDLSYFPSSFLTILTIAMLIGGGAGSTAGGIKQYRIVVTIKGVYYSIYEKLSTKGLVRTRFINRYGNNEVLEDGEYRDCVSFLMVYLIVFIVGTFALMLFNSNYSLMEASFNFSSALSGTGLAVGPQLAGANAGVLWTLLTGVFLGRLEIMVIFLAIVSVFRSIVHKGQTQ